MKELILNVRVLEKKKFVYSRQYFEGLESTAKVSRQGRQLQGACAYEISDK